MLSLRWRKWLFGNQIHLRKNAKSNSLLILLKIHRALIMLWKAPVTKNCCFCFVLMSHPLLLKVRIQVGKNLPPRCFPLNRICTPLSGIMWKFLRNIFDAHFNCGHFDNLESSKFLYDISRKSSRNFDDSKLSKCPQSKCASKRIRKNFQIIPVDG